MPTRPRTEARRPSKRKPRRLGRPPGKQGEDTRRVILIAARESFGKLGFERATNADIAAAANVTAGAMYKHFESKADLYAAAVHHALAELIPRLRELVAKHSSVRSAFRALVSVVDSFDAQQRTTARFLSSIPGEMQRHPQVAERMLSNPGEVYTIVTELVEAGVRAGEISRERAPRVVSVMIATFMGLSAYSNTLGPSFTKHAVAGLIDLLDGELFATAK